MLLTLLLGYNLPIRYQLYELIVCSYQKKEINKLGIVLCGTSLFIGIFTRIFFHKKLCKTFLKVCRWVNYFWSIFV